MINEAEDRALARPRAFEPGGGTAAGPRPSSIILMDDALDDPSTWRPTAQLWRYNLLATHNHSNWMGPLDRKPSQGLHTSGTTGNPGRALLTPLQLPRLRASKRTPWR
jgi:hypothetical protein